MRCDQKKRFLRLEDAQCAVDHMLLNLTIPTAHKRRLEAYKCDRCPWFHVGKRRKSQTPGPDGPTNTGSQP